jgi:hypothetical protein
MTSTTNRLAAAAHVLQDSNSGGAVVVVIIDARVVRQARGLRDILTAVPSDAAAIRLSFQLDVQVGGWADWTLTRARSKREWFANTRVFGRGLRRRSDQWP